MPLTRCPDCGCEVSSRSDRCVHCGCPIADAGGMLEVAKEVVCVRCRGEGVVRGSGYLLLCVVQFVLAALLAFLVFLKRDRGEDYLWSVLLFVVFGTMGAYNAANYQKGSACSVCQGKGRTTEKETRTLDA